MGAIDEKIYKKHHEVLGERYATKDYVLAYKILQQERTIVHNKGTAYVSIFGEIVFQMRDEWGSRIPDDMVSFVAFCAAKDLEFLFKEDVLKDLEK